MSAGALRVVGVQRHQTRRGGTGIVVFAMAHGSRAEESTSAPVLLAARFIAIYGSDVPFPAIVTVAGILVSSAARWC